METLHLGLQPACKETIFGNFLVGGADLLKTFQSFAQPCAAQPLLELLPRSFIIDENAI